MDDVSPMGEDATMDDDAAVGVDREERGAEAGQPRHGRLGLARAVPARRHKGGRSA